MQSWPRGAPLSEGRQQQSRAQWADPTSLANYCLSLCVCKFETLQLAYLLLQVSEKSCREFDTLWTSLTQFTTWSPVYMVNSATELERFSPDTGTNSPTSCVFPLADRASAWPTACSVPVERLSAHAM